MKRIWTLFILICTTAVLLAACGGSQVTGEATLAEVETAVDPAPVEAKSAVSSVDTADLTLIGQTGRPQFLNVYASW